jgi:hypothetical protein
MGKNLKRKTKWNAISRTCFQDRVVSFDFWLHSLSNSAHPAHSSTLEKTVLALHPLDVAHLLGKSTFQRLWPTLRAEGVSKRTPFIYNLKFYDLIWSELMTGNVFAPYRPLDKPLSKGLRSTYREIFSSTKSTAYAIAKKTKRPYAAVHSNVDFLIACGLVGASFGLHEGRRVKWLYALDGNSRHATDSVFS